MPSSLRAAATVPPGDSWNVSNRMRNACWARLPQLALVLAVALPAASVGAQGTSFQQFPSGEEIESPPSNPPTYSGTAVGGFSTADLKGDDAEGFAYWTGVVFGDSTTANDPQIKAVDLGINAQGEIGGWSEDEEGNPVDPEFGGWLIEFDNDTQSRTTRKVESGSLQVDSMGAVSGSIYIEGDSKPAELSFLQLSESRDVFAGNLAPDLNGGSVEFAAFAKIDPAFNYTAADLEGTWIVFTFSDNTQTNDPRAGHGVFEIDASGAVIGGSKSGPPGDDEWPPGLQFVIDEFGRISETSDGLGGEPILQLAEGRQIAVGSAIGFLAGGEDDHRILFFVKETTGVVPRDLAGDFLVFSFEDDRQANDPGTGQGGVYFDPTGTQLLGGTVYSTNDPSGSDFVSPHTVDVQPDGEVTLTPNHLEAWGDNFYGQVTETPLGQGYTAISVGPYHSLALRSDGLIVAWGDEVVAGPTPTTLGHTAIAAGGSHSLAIDSSGALVQWENTSFAGMAGSPPSGNDFVAIDAAGDHNVALRLDGTIESWGGSITPCAYSGAPTGTGHLAISAGYPNLAVRADGSLAAWGCGQLPSMPSDLDFADVAAGDGFGLALRNDSSIAAWGEDAYGQVSSAPAATGYTAIAAGHAHGLALRDDGTLDAWGNYWPGGSSAGFGTSGIAPGNDFAAIDTSLLAGSSELNFLALRRDDSPLTFQFSPEAGMMIGAPVNDAGDPQIILAFVPEPGAGLLGLAALTALGALGRQRFKPS